MAGFSLFIEDATTAKCTSFPAVTVTKTDILPGIAVRCLAAPDILTRLLFARAAANNNDLSNTVAAQHKLCYLVLDFEARKASSSEVTAETTTTNPVE